MWRVDEREEILYRAKKVKCFAEAQIRFKLPNFLSQFQCE